MVFGVDLGLENPKVVGWLALLHTIQRSQTAPNNPFERLQVSHFIIPCADRMSTFDLSFRFPYRKLSLQ